jgi:hypothetical protein
MLDEEDRRLARFHNNAGRAVATMAVGLDMDAAAALEDDDSILLIRSNQEVVVVVKEEKQVGKGRSKKDDIVICLLNFEGESSVFGRVVKIPYT